MNWFQKIYWSIVTSDNDQFLKTIEKKDLEIADYKNEISGLLQTSGEYQKQLSELLSINEDLMMDIEKNKKEEVLEKYWNNKRPFKLGHNYKARPAPNNSEMLFIDVKQFFVNDFNIPKVSGATVKDKMFAATRWVRQNILYTPDTTQFKLNEMWLFPFETLKLKRGDCEDMNILIANMLIASGVPYWRIRVLAGAVWDGNGTKTTKFIKAVDINTLCQSELKDFKKEIQNIITPTQSQHGLLRAKESVNQQNLKKAIFLAIREKESAESLFVNMLGKQLEIDLKFARIVEQIKNLQSITSIKIDEIIIQKTLKYYVILVIQDIIQKNQIKEDLLKAKPLGIKNNSTSGTSGHCWCTVLCDDNEWYVADAAYWPTESLKGLKWKDAEKYIDVWFSFNTKYAYLNDEMDRGRTRNDNQT